MGTKWIGENGERVWVNRGRFDASSRALRESRLKSPLRDPWKLT